MIRTTKDWKEIEIDTYNDISHLRCIAKMLKIVWWNLLKKEYLQEEINKEIYKIQCSISDQELAHEYSLK